MEMEDQYTISDLRHLISRASSSSISPAPTHSQFQPYQPPPPPPPQPDLFISRPGPTHQLHHQYEMLMMGHQQQLQVMTPCGLDHHRFNSDTLTNNSGGFEVGSARWPRQETLILLEVRSKLDHKFKEANQKGPLWDEVARIMSEEHGYQRSGKKCREKFENLYKYYKKTKEGKAGRQDGRHYRFFRQLEALYGDHHSPSSLHHHHLPHQDHLMASASDTQIVENTPHLNYNSISPQPNNTSTASLSNSTEFDTSSSNYDDEDDVLNGSMESNGSKDNNKMKKKRRWKVKIKEFIDQQMRKIMDKQEAWLDKMMKSLEEREKERIEREELWRKQDDARIEREHKFWAKERALIEARDLAFMNALEKLTSNELQWAEPELARLIQIRTSMDSRFEQCGFSEEVLWEDIAAKMAYFGHERSAIVCKEKWDSINKTLQEKENHRRKNNGKRSSNYGVISSLNGGGLYIHNNNTNNQINGLNNNGNNCEPRLQLNEGSSSSPSSHNSNINVNSTNVMNDSCLRFFLGDGDNNLGWESNYGLKGHQG